MDKKPVETKELPQDEGLGLMPSPERVAEMLGETESASEKKDDYTDEKKEATETFDQENTEENEVPVSADTEEPQFSEAELKAIERGWVPEEDFKGDPARWVNARQFNDRMNMMEKIAEQKDEVVSLRKTNEEMLKMFRKLAESDTKKRADEVLKNKHDAILEGNVEDVEKYEEEYNKIRQETESFKDLTPNTEYDSTQPKELRDFAARNKSWYNVDTPQNEEMQIYANKLDAEFFQQPYYRAMPLYRRLEEVEKAVKTAFPNRFQNPNRKRASSVESRSYPASKPATIKYDGLPPEYKTVIDNFVKGGAKISKDDYAQQLVNMGVINYG